MAESLAAATEHQGNDTPHTHGVMAVVTPYQYKSLVEIRELIERDMKEFDRIKRFIEHMCREDHYDDEKHQASVETLENAKASGLSGAPHVRISAKPLFLKHRVMPSQQPSLWDMPSGSQDILERATEAVDEDAKSDNADFEDHAQFVLFTRTTQIAS